MEVQGFKSFPEKTRLDFNDGFTAVVGPNGSGKSNIADALRWVLGEQSSRSLRGNRMEDVIFGGTQGRKPLASCSVTLFIDNKDRFLSFNEDEVAITRKYYRSGESEFKINKTAVRLKDIHELFMDTGLGRDGYSIIGQGKIAEIVSAKSSERREIFEEAAGISKFRYRKKEAENRLSHAEDNLLRLKDILVELEGRIEPLRKDSEKAERFLELSVQKKKLDLSIWTYQLSEMKERVKKLSDEVFLEDKRYKESAEAVDSLETAVNNAFEEMQSLLVDIDNLQKNIADNKESLANFGSTKAVLENDIRHNTNSLNEIKKQLESGAGEDEEYIKREKLLLENLSGKYEDFKAAEQQELSQKEELDNIYSEISSVDTKGQAKRLRRSEIYRLLDEKRGASASGKAIVEETSLQLKNFEDTVRNTEFSSKEIDFEKQEITGLISALEGKISALSNEISEKKQQKNFKAEKHNNLLAKRNDTLSNLSSLNQKIKLLEDMDRNLEGFSGSVKFVMSSAEKGMLKGIISPVSSVIEVDKKYSVAVEVVLGAAMQNIITTDDEAAKSAIRLLQSKNVGRATFLPLSTIKGNVIKPQELFGKQGYIGIASELVKYELKFKGIADSLLGRTIVADTLDNAVKLAKQSGHRYRIVTLDGQLLNTGGSMTGGAMVRSAGILGRATQISELKTQVVELEGVVNKSALELTELSKEVQVFDEEISKIMSSMRLLEDEKIGYTAEAKRIDISLSVAKESVLTAKQRYEDIKNRLKQNEELSKTVDEEIISLEQELNRTEEEITEGNFIREQLNTRKVSLENLSSENKTLKLILEREIKNLEERVFEVSEENKRRDNHKSHLISECNRLSEQNELTKLRIDNLEEERDRLTSSVGLAQTSITDKSQRRNNLEQELNQKKQLQKQTEIVRDNSYRSLVERQSRLESAENEQKTIVNNLWEMYELTVGEAIEFAEPIDSIDTATKSLSEVRGKIKSLGNVNLGAIEEFKEVSERYIELDKQVTDVESAKDELLDLINKLTESMCDIFREKFYAVNSHFKDIFVELFGGGKASLALTDPANVLESGIEINVQPPGKVIKNLIQLSGGEQAFIAIAIYFAIMKVNPTPFCLLDEIEAALDDVNIGRFASYLKDMAATMQFLVITHRRGTMEEAERLYGVTMQEDGVSKLLELKVEEISKMLGIKE